MIVDRCAIRRGGRPKRQLEAYVYCLRSTYTPHRYVMIDASLMYAGVTRDINEAALFCHTAPGGNPKQIFNRLADVWVTRRKPKPFNRGLYKMVYYGGLPKNPGWKASIKEIPNTFEIDESYPKKRRTKVIAPVDVPIGPIRPRISDRERSYGKSPIERGICFFCKGEGCDECNDTGRRPGGAFKGGGYL